ncbi:MAG TPA: 5'-nucleotidase [Myxococcaceae bacterium]|nr:5'-nucleotidase [Myxococcaceae bacterium]
MLLLDAGNALWKAGAGADGETKRRAAFVLETMGKLGTAAMAAGARDLTAGPAWLKEQSERAGVRIVSANLLDAGGKRLFPASIVVDLAGKKIAVIGASPVGSFEDARGGPIVASVVAEARKVRPKVDVVLVLAAVPYADALQLSREAGTAVDFIFQSHEGRGIGPMQRGDSHFVLRTGDRGRQVGRLSIDVAGVGPWVDPAELERNQQAMASLEGHIAEVKRRLDAAPDAQTKAALEETARHFAQRRNELSAQVQAARTAGGRKVALDWLTLTGQFQEDATLAAAVKRIEPHGAAH